jgi:hypothetical protein
MEPKKRRKRKGRKRRPFSLGKGCVVVNKMMIVFVCICFYLNRVHIINCF